MTDLDMPFHSGELEAQRRAGVGDVASRVSSFIRDHMPEQHRTFYEALPFMVAASNDAQGRTWATVIEGGEGFIRSPNPQALALATELDPADPLAESFGKGAEIGILGIELASRRRNRLSGTIKQGRQGLSIDVRQTFGNCPQYIHERDWWRVERSTTAPPSYSDHLSADQIERIRTTDTLFIGSGQTGRHAAVSNGFDASHRGGEPGFVHVPTPTRIRIPDYAGNNFFNTIGNLLENPSIGLLFIDFSTGGVLQITGHAEIDWTPDDRLGPDVRRVIDVTIDAVIERPDALSLRWSEEPKPSFDLIVTDKVMEAEGVMSFYLSPVDGGPIAPFQAGQHLPIALEIPGQFAKVRRSYSLSAGPNERTYRITVKREPFGIASSFLHDHVELGDVIEARPPIGDFVVPEGDGPLVLISAGIGLTPMVAMLEQIVSEGNNRPIWFVHGARNRRQHVLSDQVDRLARSRPNIEKRVHYSAPEAQDRIGTDYDFEGRITTETLLNLAPGSDAQYMLCGPTQFVTALTAGLEAAGVANDRIHFESFG